MKRCLKNLTLKTKQALKTKQVFGSCFSLSELQRRLWTIWDLYTNMMSDKRALIKCNKCYIFGGMTLDCFGMESRVWQGWKISPNLFLPPMDQVWETTVALEHVGALAGLKMLSDLDLDDVTLLALILEILVLSWKCRTRKHCQFRIEINWAKTNQPVRQCWNCIQCWIAYRLWEIRWNHWEGLPTLGWVLKLVAAVTWGQALSQK